MSSIGMNELMGLGRFQTWGPDPQVYGGGCFRGAMPVIIVQGCCPSGTAPPTPPTPPPFLPPPFQRSEPPPFWLPQPPLPFRRAEPPPFQRSEPPPFQRSEPPPFQRSEPPPFQRSEPPPVGVPQLPPFVGVPAPKAPPSVGVPYPASINVGRAITTITRDPFKPDPQTNLLMQVPPVDQRLLNMPQRTGVLEVRSPIPVPGPSSSGAALRQGLVATPVMVSQVPRNVGINFPVKVLTGAKTATVSGLGRRENDMYFGRGFFGMGNGNGNGAPLVQNGSSMEVRQPVTPQAVTSAPPMTPGSYCVLTAFGYQQMAAPYANGQASGGLLPLAAFSQQMAPLSPEMMAPRSTPFVLEQIAQPILDAQGVTFDPLALIGERF